MNKPENNNAFENSWSEMTNIFQNQFSVWMKMSEDYFNHMSELQTKMFDGFQTQFDGADVNTDTNDTAKEKPQKPHKSEALFDTDMIVGNWKQVMGDVQKKWSKLTNDNLAPINGSREKLLMALQKNYSIAREEAEKQMKEWESSRSETRKTATNQKG